MKKFLLFLLMASLTKACLAYWDTVEMYQSSYTAANNTTTVLANTPPGTVFAGVVISTSVGGTLKVYDSSGAASGQIANLLLSGNGEGSFCIPFNVVVSSGITYTTTGNSGGITFIFKRTK